MQIRRFGVLVLGIILCLGMSGCANKSKSQPSGRYGYGLSTSRGLADAAGFAESDDQARDMLTQRKIYFDFDSSVVHERDMDIIQAHADYLRAKPRSHARIEGHTDEQGSREYNVALAERRARAVVNALRANGVPGDQLSTVSYGKEKPDVDGHSEEAYRLNRRAVIVYEEI